MDMYVLFSMCHVTYFNWWIRNVASPSQGREAYHEIARFFFFFF